MKTSVLTLVVNPETGAMISNGRLQTSILAFQKDSENVTSSKNPEESSGISSQPNTGPSDRYLESPIEDLTLHKNSENVNQNGSCVETSNDSQPETEIITSKKLQTPTLVPQKDLENISRGENPEKSDISQPDGITASDKYPETPIQDLAFQKSLEILISNNNSDSSTQEQIKHPASFWGTIFHLIFLSAGCPVLLIPKVFITTGYLAGSITLLLIFAFYVYCMRMLLWSTQQMCNLKQLPMLTYSDLVYQAFHTGPPLARILATSAWLVSICNFFLSWYGGCILLLVLIADNLKTVGSSWLNIDLENGMVLLLFVPILILNLIRTLKFLEPCSIAGFIFNFMTILIVLYYSIADPAPWEGKYQVNSWNNVPALMGVVFLNINVTGLIISLKNEMKHPEKFEAPLGVMTISYSFIFIMYFLFSVFFSLKYGVKVPTNALGIIPSNLVLYFVTVILYVIGLYLLFPLILYVPLNAILKGLFTKHKLEVHGTLYEYGFRIILVLVAVFFAYLNPNISFFVTLFGTVGTSIDSIIFPALVHSLVIWKVAGRSIKTGLILVKNMILFILGLGLIVAGIQNSFGQL